MNCKPSWVTQNAIPEEQELILLSQSFILKYEIKLELENAKAYDEEK